MSKGKKIYSWGEACLSVVVWSTLSFFAGMFLVAIIYSESSPESNGLDINDFVPTCLEYEDKIVYWVSEQNCKVYSTYIRRDSEPFLLDELRKGECHGSNVWTPVVEKVCVKGHEVLAR